MGESERERHAAVDLGDGKITLRASGQDFSVDALGWMRWMAQEMPPGNLYEALDAAKKKVAADGGPPLNDSQANALLHAVRMECEAKKKQRAGELSSLLGSA